MSPVTGEDIIAATKMNLVWPEGAYCPVNRKRRIYFVQAATGEIKIGVTTAPKIHNKLRQMRTYCPSKMKLLAVVVEGDLMPEHEIHRKFKALRLHGEWFSPDGELLEWIKAIKK